MKAVFIAALVIQAVLWSNSRYAAPIRQSSSLSLARRSLLEESAHDAVCHPLSFPQDHQCTHALKSCPKSHTFLRVNYLHNYFCSSPGVKPLMFIGLLIWLFFLFSTLGISASDFFTPNLATIAQLLGLNENVAGVTFLAFGNGSPDVFSTFSAMRAQSGSLAIGELLGAASFITSCVVGSMCIIKPFRVEQTPFLRDVGFLALAVLLMLIILWDEWLAYWEAGLLVGLYVLYAAVVVIGNWWQAKQDRKRRIESLMRSEYREDVVPYHDEPVSPSPTPSAITAGMPNVPRPRAISSPPPMTLGVNTDVRTHTSDMSASQPSLSPHSAGSHSHSHYPQMPSFSLVGALEFRDVVASLQREASIPALSIFESPVTPFAGGHYHSHSRPRTPNYDDEINPFDTSLHPALPLDERGEPDQESEPPLLTVTHPDGVSHPVGLERPFHARSITTSEVSETESQRTFTPISKRRRVTLAISHIYHILFPSLHHFREKTILAKLASLFAAPAIVLLTLTLPVVVTDYTNGQSAPEKLASGDARLVDFEEEGVERVLIAEDEAIEDLHDMTYNKWLMAIQCLLGPLFCVTVLFSESSYQTIVLVTTAIVGLCVGTLVAIFSKAGDHPLARMARCSMGFIVAVVWIMAIADEVVQVLQTFGRIFGLSDAIIGLTIFAVGNSLADLVANMSVAVFAPIMGFSACFGGPMLNILLGIGISGLVVISQSGGQPYYLEFSNTLFGSGVGLLIILLMTLTFIPLNGYYLTKRWGMFIVLCYFILMSANIFIETSSHA